MSLNVLNLGVLRKITNFNDQPYFFFLKDLNPKQSQY